MLTFVRPDIMGPDWWQLTVRLIQAGAFIAHTSEAVFAFFLARARRLPSIAWFLQTWAIGFPSLRLLLQVAAERKHQ